jgi:hypothetical protein
MKAFLKKYCPIISKILTVPFLLMGIFAFCLELFGAERVDGFLLSLQIPFNSVQILTVGSVIFLIWLPCYTVTAYYKEREAKTAAEAADEAKLRVCLSENFVPGKTDTPLRTAAKDVKCRILLEQAVGTYRICYRRVGKTNELMVNGMVYDDMTATLEGEHELTATVDGHDIRVGLDNTNHSYVTFDGETVAKKIRWI